MRDQSRFEDDQLFRCDRFPHFANVRFYKMLESGVGQPDACKTMSMLENHNGIQADSFKHRGEEQRGIQTGRQSALQHNGRPTSLLAGLFKAAGRIRVREFLSRDCRPGRCGQHVRSTQIARLITIQRRRVTMSTKRLRCLLHQSSYRRIIWHHKRCQQLRAG